MTFNQSNVALIGTATANTSQPPPPLPTGMSIELITALGGALVGTFIRPAWGWFQKKEEQEAGLTQLLIKNLIERDEKAVAAMRELSSQVAILSEKIEHLAPQHHSSCHLFEKR